MNPQLRARHRIGRAAVLTLCVLTTVASVATIMMGSTAAFALQCDYYAAPDGRGDGRTSSTPFTIQNFWSVATAGKTLCLEDGTYQGDRNMITPPAGLSGTPGRPITLRALNDGAATIDGQFVRQPIVLTNNNWLELEGFNAKSSAYSVMALHGSFSNNTFRRLVLWDAHMQRNVSVVENDCSGVSTNILFEDVAIFGTGRKMIVGGGCVSTDIWTFRRVWTRWEGQTFPSGPVLSTNYNSFGFTCENCLTAFTGESMPQEYDVTDTSGNVIGPHMTNFDLPPGTGAGLPGTDRQRSSATACANIKVYGSLGYLPSTAHFNSASGDALMSAMDSCSTWKHVFAYVSPDHPRFSQIYGFRFWNGDPNYGTSPITAASVQNYTSLRSANKGDLFENLWRVSNGSIGSTLNAVADPWTTTGDGANLCYRWTEGDSTPSATPLWPWPMNQRIKDATASAGAYSGPCVNCVGGRAARKATDVTADIEAMLGTIPPQCKAAPE